jgi:hypothetical protein
MTEAVTHVCDIHSNYLDCSDNFIEYDQQWNGYGLIIHNWVVSGAG